MLVPTCKMRIMELCLCNHNTVSPCCSSSLIVAVGLKNLRDGTEDAPRKLGSVAFALQLRGGGGQTMLGHPTSIYRIVIFVTKTDCGTCTERQQAETPRGGDLRHTQRTLSRGPQQRNKPHRVAALFLFFHFLEIPNKSRALRIFEP